MSSQQHLVLIPPKKFKSSFAEVTDKFVDFYNEMGENAPPINSTNLERFFKVCLEKNNNEVVWASDSQTPWDLWVKNLDKKIQVKGSKIKPTGKLRFSSFRLSSHFTESLDKWAEHKRKKPQLFSEIDKMVSPNDCWWLCVRTPLEKNTQTRLDVYQFDRKSFLYQEKTYDFLPTEGKNCMFKTTNGVVETRIEFTSGFQIWHEIPNWEESKVKLKGVVKLFSHVILSSS